MVTDWHILKQVARENCVKFCHYFNLLEWHCWRLCRRKQWRESTEDRDFVSVLFQWQWWSKICNHLGVVMAMGARWWMSRLGNTWVWDLMHYCVCIGSKDRLKSFHNHRRDNYSLLPFPTPPSSPISSLFSKCYNSITFLHSGTWFRCSVSLRPNQSDRPLGNVTWRSEIIWKSQSVAISGLVSNGNISITSSHYFLIIKLTTVYTHQSPDILFASYSSPQYLSSFKFRISYLTFTAFIITSQHLLIDHYLIFSWIFFQN